MEKVAVGARCHALNVVRARSVEAFVLGHQFMLQGWQLESLPDTNPQVFGGLAVVKVQCGLRAQRVGGGACGKLGLTVVGGSASFVFELGSSRVVRRAMDLVMAEGCPAWLFSSVSMSTRALLVGGNAVPQAARTRLNTTVALMASGRGK